MPLFTVCRYPGCHAPAPRGSRYCERHREAGVKRDAIQAEKAKKFREARRRAIKGTSILQHPYCEHCAKEGRLTPATDVDHVNPHRGDPVLMWSESNLQALCHVCHARKTAREDGGFGNRSQR